MSVRAMAAVWELPIDQGLKLVLLAYADHADHEGNSIFPSVSSIAKKTGYDERSIQRITKKLMELGLLFNHGRHPHYQTNIYSLPFVGGDKLSPPDMGGDFEAMGGDKALEGGDILTPGGDILTPGGDIAMSPEPSILNHQLNPSSKPSIIPPERKNEDIHSPPNSSRPHPLAPSTPGAEYLFSKLRANAALKGHRGPARFGTQEAKQRWEEVERALGERETRHMVDRCLGSNIVALNRITNYLAKVAASRHLDDRNSRAARAKYEEWNRRRQ